MDVTQMSLINSMLRDLDARTADGPGGQFERHVRAVPAQDPARGRRWTVIAASVAVIGAAGAAGAVWLGAGERLVPKAPVLAATPVAKVAAVAVAPAVVAPSVTAVTAPPPAAEETVTAAAAVTPVAAPVVSPVVAAVAAPSRAVEAAAASAAVATRPAIIDTPVEPERSAAKPAAAAAVMAAAPVAREAPPGRTAPASPPRVTESTPLERADGHYSQGLELLRQGKADIAVGALEQALRQNPRHGAARQALVSTLIEGGRKDEAMRVAQEGLAALPSQPAVAMTLARLQVEKGELRPAIATLERSLPYGAGATGYEAFLAALLQRDEQHKQAVEQYLVALKKSPDAGVWWMGLGISYQALQRHGDAIEAFRRAKASGSLSSELGAFVDGRLGQLQR
jgi:MSHA biogenesis protein MshN